MSTAFLRTLSKNRWWWWMPMIDVVNLGQYRFLGLTSQSEHLHLRATETPPFLSLS